MAKLYPPTIPGTIPAFYTGSNGTSIEVPFSMNRAVGLSEFNGFALKIKKVSGTLIGTVFKDSVGTSLETGIVKFNIPVEISKVPIKELKYGDKFTLNATDDTIYVFVAIEPINKRYIFVNTLSGNIKSSSCNMYVYKI